METTQSIRKYRYPATCAMGHEAPQAGGGVDDLYPAHVTQLHTKRKWC